MMNLSPLRSGLSSALRSSPVRGAESKGKARPCYQHGRAKGMIVFEPITPKDNTDSEDLQVDIISKKITSGRFYAYHAGRFWFWDEARNLWKESHLLTQKYNIHHETDKRFTPEDFMTDPSQFEALEDYQVDYLMKNALKDAVPCQNAPIDPVEEPEAAVSAPAAQKPEPLDAVPDAPAPSFDFGADDQTNALLLQDAQTFITGNMARIMAAKHAHDLTANHYKGSWGKWCAAVGISRDTGDRMVSVAAQCGNIQLEGKSILDVQPMKLLYAAAKPSTPEAVKQAVFSGDITTYKEYQELMAQLKNERDRADAAEGQRDAALADVNGLNEQNEELQQHYNAANDALYDANLQRKKAESERDKAEARAKAAEDALKNQPIAGVVDKEEVARQAKKLFADMADEEVDRRAHQQAYDIAAGMTEELKADKANLQKDMDKLKRQLAEAQAVVPADLVADKETAEMCLTNIDGIWGMALPAFQRLIGTGDGSDFNRVAGNLIQLCDRIHETLVKMTIANDKVTQYE